MGLSNELRDELRMRMIDMGKHAKYCEERAAELRDEAEGFQKQAIIDRGKAQELSRLLEDDGQVSVPFIPMDQREFDRAISESIAREARKQGRQ